MENYISSKPVTSIFTTQLCYYCCSDLQYVKECSQRCELTLQQSNNQYIINDSSLVTFELRKHMMDVIIEKNS